MKDLTSALQTVYSATSLNEKKIAMLSLIADSHAKNTTKATMSMRVKQLTNPAKVDSFATNYMLSGEGMKV